MTSQRVSPWSRFGKLPTFVFILCISQPLMDVLSYWVEELQISNAITLVLRFAMLAVIALAGYRVSRRRRVYWMGAGILAVLTAGHVWAQLGPGYGAVTGDLANLLRIYQMPICTVCFISFLRADPDVLPALRKGFFWNILIIALVEILSLLTNTNPYTYRNSREGLLGWFYFANSQSAILSAAAPVAIAWAIETLKKRPVILTLVMVVNLGLLYGLGTRLAYLGLFAAGMGLVISLLLIDRKQKRTMVSLLLVTVLFLGAFPLSPMYRNQKTVSENAVKKQNHINSLVSTQNFLRHRQDLMAAADPEPGQLRPMGTPFREDSRLGPLELAYESYLGGLVHRFGLERVAELYGYSTKVSDLSNIRKLRINYCRLLMQDRPVSSLLFGLELGDLTWEGYIYDVENDLHGIFFQCGAVGLLLMVLFLAWFPIRILWVLIRDWRRYFTLQAASFGIGFLTSMTHVWATAGMLRRPNASIYLSVILAAIFWLSRPDQAEI